MGIKSMLDNASGDMRSKIHGFIVDSCTDIMGRLYEPNLIYDEKSIRFDYSLAESSRNARLFVGTYLRDTKPEEYADKIIDEFMNWLEESKKSLWTSGSPMSKLQLSSYCGGAGVYTIFIDPEV